jgi:hypothetical protein
LVAHHQYLARYVSLESSALKQVLLPYQEIASQARFQFRVLQLAHLALLESTVQASVFPPLAVIAPTARSPAVVRVLHPVLLA